MAEKLRPMKFGWYGDHGHGERLIQEILSGKKTATASLAYEVEDADVKVGEKMDLVDKKGRRFGTIVIDRIEIRLFGAFDDALARACGHADVKALREAARFANEREPRPDEEMRVTHFRLVGVSKPRV
jgi:uncharacterized protein YhfF